uniref:Small G protein signaling modulator 1-like n=1 Tax=Sinocyclocheilus grahami TaxID=75366 RepID=A0A672T5Y9_SINGR
LSICATEADVSQPLLTKSSVVSPCVTQVKQIMEEAVTRKFVHEDSSHIVSFCDHIAKTADLLYSTSRRSGAFFRNMLHNSLFKLLFCPGWTIAMLSWQSLSYSESTRKMPKVPNFSLQAVRHLWIHTALIEKVLDKIVLYLVENSSKFYEKEAILMDPVDGPILASLLVGPCALEYTKMKTADHFWTDPSADELVQRHRIHSGHCRQDSPTKRPALCILLREELFCMVKRISLCAKHHVFNLVIGDSKRLCHLNVNEHITLFNINSIVYVFLSAVDCGGTVVLVSQDGIQRPPLRFPRGGHLLQFLSCLENGLLPHGQLDPPLWSQRGKGKVFPKLKKRCPQGSSDSVSDKEEEEATDYVFRIVFPNSQSEFVAPELIDQGVNMWHPTPRKSSCSSCSRSSFSDGAPPNGCNHERAPLKLLCDNMKNQIISRAFYGWLAYCRHLSTVRTHLSGLVNHTIVEPDVPTDTYGGLTTEVWQKFLQDCSTYEEKELLRLVYFGGVEPSLRKEVWPFLLGHYQFGMSEAERKEVDEQMRACYEQTMSEWLGCEAIVRQREKEQHAVALAKCSSGASIDSTTQRIMHRDSTISNESSQSCSSGRQRDSRLQSDSSSGTQVFESVEEVDQIESEPKSEDIKHVSKISNGTPQNGTSSPDSGHPSSRNFSVTSGQSDSLSTEDSGIHDPSLKAQLQLAVSKERFASSSGEEGKVTEEGETKSVEKLGTYMDDANNISGSQIALRPGDEKEKKTMKTSNLPNEAGTAPSSDGMNFEEPEMESLCPQLDSLAVNTTNEATSPVSSIGTTYSQELLDMYSLNLHRIDKDVQRCDRNYWYFTPANLEKLRNIMCSYIWQHLEIGYVQGMCDLLAPLLVILDDEAMAFSCFTELMTRMNQNFPHGGAMDTHFANMRSLIQILDAELFELMHQNGDYTHFYFCYRWFLLDFKRELVYDDVFAVWEVIWAAKCVSSSHFVLFIALALVEIYRDIILENNMDFTDIIKFFNEMAEHHNIKQILTLARDLVCKVQTLIENK